MKYNQIEYRKNPKNKFEISYPDDYISLGRSGGWAGGSINIIGLLLLQINNDWTTGRLQNQYLIKEQNHLYVIK